MNLVYVTAEKEDSKGNTNAFHVLGNFSLDINGDFATGETTAKVIINVSSYISKEKYDLGCKCNESNRVILDPDNSGLDFEATADQLTNEKLATEVAKQFGGDGTEFTIEEV